MGACGSSSVSGSGLDVVVEVEHDRLRRSNSSLKENLVKRYIDTGDPTQENSPVAKNIREQYNGVDAEYEILGRGLTGVVKVIRRKSDDKKFALKIMPLDNLSADELARIRGEVRILCSMDHPHIARLYETYEESERTGREGGRDFYLVMEFCSGGDMYTHLQNTRCGFPEKESCAMIRAMLSSICYIHGKGVAHRDLKLENFVRTSPGDNQKVKLIDFGLSKFGLGDVTESKSQHFVMKETVGTTYYMAPEVLRRRYGPACDLWSIGVIAYMLLCGSAPFEGPDDRTIRRLIKKGIGDFKGPVWEKISDDAKSFVRALLQVDPDARLTAMQALDHPWIVALKNEGGGTDKRPSPMTPGQIQQLHCFAGFGELKRLAIHTMAFFLDPGRVSDMQTVFDNIDVNHNGYITFEELKAAMEAYGPADEGKLRRIFASMDVDNSQRVEASDFVAAMLTDQVFLTEEKMRDAFQNMDVGNTGKIDTQDMRDLLGKQYDEEQVRAMIDVFDLTRDGQLNYAEFKHMMRGTKPDNMTDLNLEETSDAASAHDVASEELAVPSKSPIDNLAAETSANRSADPENLPGTIPSPGRRDRAPR